MAGANHARQRVLFQAVLKCTWFSQVVLVCASLWQFIILAPVLEDRCMRLKAIKLMVTYLSYNGGSPRSNVNGSSLPRGVTSCQLVPVFVRWSQPVSAHFRQCLFVPGNAILWQSCQAVPANDSLAPRQSSESRCLQLKVRGLITIKPICKNEFLREDIEDVPN